MIMEYDKSKFNLDYTEDVGAIISLVKKEIVVTEIPDTPGEHTIYLNLEIKDIYDKSTYLKFPIKLIVNPIEVVKLDSPSELKTNEANDTNLTLEQTTPQLKAQKSIFSTLQEAILVLTLSGLIATISLMLLSRDKTSPISLISSRLVLCFFELLTPAVKMKRSLSCNPSLFKYLAA